LVKEPENAQIEDLGEDWTSFGEEAPSDIKDDDFA